MSITFEILRLCLLNAWHSFAPLLAVYWFSVWHRFLVQKLVAEKYSENRILLVTLSCHQFYPVISQQCRVSVAVISDLFYYDEASVAVILALFYYEKFFEGVSLKRIKKLPPQSNWRVLLSWTPKSFMV